MAGLGVSTNVTQPSCIVYGTCQNRARYPTVWPERHSKGHRRKTRCHGNYLPRPGIKYSLTKPRQPSTSRNDAIISQQFIFPPSYLLGDVTSEIHGSFRIPKLCYPSKHPPGTDLYPISGRSQFTLIKAYVMSVLEEASVLKLT